MSEWIPERLPEDPEAEKALLATLCSPGREAEAAEYSFAMDERDFVAPAHQAWFRAMASLVRQNLEINPLTLKDALAEAGDLGRVGGYTGLVELMGAEEVGRPQVLMDILRRKRRHRSLIRMGAKLVRAAAEESDDPMNLVRSLGQELSAMLQSGQGRKKTVHVSEVTAEVVARLVDRMQGLRSRGVRIGYSRLDGMTDGLPKGGLIVLAARPSVGKTALAMNWLHRAAARYGVCCGFFSLEMSREEVVGRLIAAEAKMDLRTITGNGYNDVVLQAIGAAQNRIDALPLHIDDQATITGPELVAKIHQLYAQTGGELELVVVDYLQLIGKDHSNKNKSDAALIGDITRALKLCAKELQIPIVILSQLNREIEKRTNARPMLSDLKDSGSIEQDADMVIFIHRNVKACRDGEAPDLTADLIVAKHRNGPVGSIPMIFKAEWTQYLEMERTTDALTVAKAPVAPASQASLYE